ncbi:hypothetical protein QN239_08975 [Mycolicibacterium sp. Y3]
MPTPTPRSRYRMPPKLFDAALRAHPPVPYNLDRLDDDLFMPSACPVGSRFYSELIDVLVPSYTYTVDSGGETVTTHHDCPVCGASWTQGGWPSVMVGLTAAGRRSA